MLVMQFLVVDIYARFWTYELFIQTIFEHTKTGKKSVFSGTVCKFCAYN